MSCTLAFLHSYMADCMVVCIVTWLIVCMIVCMQVGCSQPQVWQQWYQDGKDYTGIVYMSEVKPPSDILEAAWMIPPHSSFRSGIGIVRNEIAMYQQALQWYPQAQWFYLVSGDSVPAKPAMVFNQPLGGCITGAKEFTQPEWAGWYHGTQWMLLERQHVQQLVEEWPKREPGLMAVHKDYICPICSQPADCPDEQYIHTILHHYMKVPVFHPGVSIMEEMVDEQLRQCQCMAVDQHAKLFEWVDEGDAGDPNAQLKSMLLDAKQDPLTFAVRKIGSSVPHQFILETLRV